jgi:sn-glycerol 3-phosphate transport system substrate-binding protein
MDWGPNRGHGVRWLFAIVMAGMLAAGSARAATEIRWWHAMNSELGRMVEQLAADFNASQNDYKIVPDYKGPYTETMTAALFAIRTGQHPAIVQVNEIATATMMAAKGATYPVHQLMREQGATFDPQAYLPAVSGYYADSGGNLLSFPFNTSTPILYYNKDQFRLAGLDAETAPRTWPEVEAAAKKLIAAGVPCGFTTAWPSWIHVENLSALHDVAIATKVNGFGGLDTELLISNDIVERHLTTLARWQKAKIFDYGGRADRADAKFYGSQCGMYVSSSATRPDILANAKFEVGYGLTPYWPDVAAAPQNAMIGGATLWVLKGRPVGEYKGVAKFFVFLSRPEIQARWHQASGYLPITRAAYELTRKQGFYDRNPGTDISIKQITLKEPTANTKGLRLGSFVQVREVIEDEIEQAIFGKVAPKAALDSAVRRGNEILRRFEKANP